MSSVLSSQGLVLATAMAVSSTVLFLAFSRHKTTFLPTQFSGTGSYNDSQQPKKHVLRSCLCSGDSRKKKQRKKKKVQFAENVKEPSGNGEEFKKQHKKTSKSEKSSNSRNQMSGIRGMPANRIALYNGILRDRVHRMECSY
ncbi:uncharacterized protein LOC107407483 [Ziziphus jujuba]|uniref:Uncharacterized protein LOC107407483 n=2 Tax=Ziziphus jujuba TaxID=326968 RepID=A0A6P3YZF0_ZIZJJ|nr:uncharacterized protein LOC107407483 [Ziziphus jujuba]KAH7547398.1 hypothetical protein FEM48_Zijuj01G0305500 [Ziziphus jujuba var. spinosa]